MESILTRNLTLLPQPLRDEMTRVAGEADRSTGYCVTRSKSGHVVTGKIVAGRERFFHSTYDPLKEARRLSDGVATPTVIVLGFGSGHHLETLLQRVDHLIVIEPDLGSVLYAMEQIDLTAVLSQSGLHLMLGDAAREPGNQISESYLPVIHGSAAVTALPGRVQAEPELFNTIQNALREALERIADDFAVQARFGRLWTRNTIQNLAALAGGVSHRTSRRLLTYPDMAGLPVIVTAAGPSLGESLDYLRARGDAVLLATDTSLPTLTASGITPDAVMTVDCQPVSYLHYLTADFPQTLLIADLAAPPAVLRNYDRLGPVVSPHPLHQLICAAGGVFARFDSSGGNVTHAAVSLAVSLGAASIQVIGADFAYPRGQGYARGSYVELHFGVRASRTHPMAGGLYQFVWNRPGVYRDQEVPTTIRQPALDSYAAALARLAASTDVPITFGPHGAADPGGRSAAARTRRGVLPAEIIVPSDLLVRIRMLFAAAADAGTQLSEWTRTEMRATTAALLPLVAWYRRGNPGEAVETLLQMAHRETVDLLNHFTES